MRYLYAGTVPERCRDVAGLWDWALDTGQHAGAEQRGCLEFLRGPVLIGQVMPAASGMQLAEYLLLSCCCCCCRLVGLWATPLHSLNAA